MATAAHTKPTKPWQEIVAAKLARKASLIPADWRLSPELARTVDNGGPADVRHIPAQSGILSEIELEITESPVEVLLPKLAKGEWKAYDVCLAFCKRAAIADQLINCLTEIRFAEALEEAKQLDNSLKLSGKLSGPLHGLPISLQDSYPNKGCDSSQGFVAECEKPEEHDDKLVELLRAAGAIPGFCKTNQPAGGVGIHPWNEVFGHTTCPINRHLGAGGAVAEPTLIALHGSPLGFGYDSGGGTRTGSSLNGVYNLVPTSNRMRIARPMGAMPRSEAIMCNSVEGLELCAKGMIESGGGNPAEPSLCSWQVPQAKKSLTFGIIEHMNTVHLHPPILRGLHDTMHAISQAGHVAVPFKIQAGFNAEAQRVSLVLWTVKGLQDDLIRCQQSGEPLPPRTRWDLKPLPADQLRMGLDDAEKWRGQLAALWSEDIDAVISPVIQQTAFKLGEDSPTGMMFYTGHCQIWTLADYAVCVIPVTEVQAGDEPDLDFVPFGDAKDDNGHKLIPRIELDQKVHDTYSPSKYAGAQIGIQIVCKGSEEEKVLQIAREVQRCLRASVARS